MAGADALDERGDIGLGRLIAPYKIAMQRRIRQVQNRLEQGNFSGVERVCRIQESLQNGVELAHTLAASDQVARCAVEQLAHHALGRTLPHAAVDRLVEDFEARDRDLVPVFRALVLSSDFLQRVGAP